MEYIKKIYVEGKGLDFQLSRKKIYLDLFRFKLISEIEFIWQEIKCDLLKLM